MKRLLDVNTWIALTLETHPQHAPARQWYASAPLVARDLVFCRSTELGFLRLVTQKAVMNRCGAEPLTNTAAVDFLASVYGDPVVSRLNEAPTTRDLWLDLARGPQASPNVWMDAYLAALSIGLGAQMVTFDRGFVVYQDRGLNLLLLDAS